MSVSLEEVLRAVGDSRDSVTAQLGGIRASIATITEEQQRITVRVAALEQAARFDSPEESTPAYRELLSELRVERMRREATEAYDAERVRTRRVVNAAFAGVGVVIIVSQILLLLGVGR